MDFGYIYMDREFIGLINSLNKYSNSINIFYKDNTSLENKWDAVNKIKKTNNIAVLDNYVFEDSSIKTSIDEDCDTIKTVASILPFVVFLICLVCCSLFVGQIIRHSYKTIGVLKSLGYSSSAILIIFIWAVIFITILSMIIGAFLGYYLNNFCVKQYQAVYCFDIVYLVIDPILIVYLVCILLIVVLSCVFNFGKINKLKPFAIYNNQKKSNPNSLISKINFPIYIKVALFDILRNKYRFIAISVCIACCFLLTFVSVAGLISKNQGQNSLSNDMFKYDILVYIDNGQETIDQIKSNNNNIECIEPILVDNLDVEQNGNTENIQINAILNNSSLVKVFDQKRNIVDISNGICIEEYTAKKLGIKKDDEITIKNQKLKVSSISREYSNFIQYVSFDTAKELGYTNYNRAAIKFKPNTDINAEINKLSDVKGCSYIKYFDHQIETRKQSTAGMDFIFYLSITISLLVGLCVICNGVILSFEEKKYDYASLKALGVKISNLISGIIIEFSLQFLISIILANIPARFIANVFLWSISSEVQNYPFIYYRIVLYLTISVSCIYFIFAILYKVIRYNKLNLLLLNSHE